MFNAVNLFTSPFIFSFTLTFYFCIYYCHFIIETLIVISFRLGLGPKKPVKIPEKNIFNFGLGRKTFWKFQTFFRFLSFFFIFFHFFSFFFVFLMLKLCQLMKGTQRDIELCGFKCIKAL